MHRRALLSCIRLDVAAQLATESAVARAGSVGVHTAAVQPLPAFNSAHAMAVPCNRGADVRWEHSTAEVGSLVARVAGFSTVVPGQISDRAPDDAADAGLIDTTLSEGDFQRMADLTIGEMWKKIDQFVDSKPELKGSTTLQLTQGRLELNLKDGGALVVNKDPAVQQLHTSSSATGDVSYEYAGDQTWTSLIDGRDIHDAVEDELRPALGSDLDLEPEAHTEYGPT